MLSSSGGVLYGAGLFAGGEMNREADVQQVLLCAERRNLLCQFGGSAAPATSSQSGIGPGGWAAPDARWKTGTGQRAAVFARD